MVRRVRPAVLRKARQVRYEVPGNLSCFSHCFRGKYETAIQAGLFDEVARRIVVGELPTYMGHVFEDVCRQWFLWEDRGDRLDVAPLEVRRWWGTNPVERCEEEIDIVLSGVDGELILGECKWNNRSVDASVLGVLKRRTELLPGGRDAQLFLFSKSGFERERRQRALADGNVRLVDVGGDVPYVRCFWRGNCYVCVLLRVCE